MKRNTLHPAASFTMLCAVSTLSTVLVLAACGDKKSADPAPAAAPTPTPEPKAADSKSVQPDLKNTDLLALAAPCKEDEENTGRVIKVDNEPIAQFCENRKWGNPYVEASSFKCRAIGFSPVLTDDKTGVSCRNPAGVVSLNTRWYPSGEGLEMCNPGETNLWMPARDREGKHIALRCDESGMLDGSSTYTKFACNDPDRAYQTILLDAGRGVTCRNEELAITSLITADGANYLTNSNCETPGTWVLYKSRQGKIEAAKCEAEALPALGTFLNLSSVDGTFSCDAGKVPSISGDGLTVTCIVSP